MHSNAERMAFALTGFCEPTAMVRVSFMAIFGGCSHLEFQRRVILHLTPPQHSPLELPVLPDWEGFPEAGHRALITAVL